jgi:cyclophilin family peptidyl-prolyl cis-trans isomerase
MELSNMPQARSPARPKTLAVLCSLAATCLSHPALAQLAPVHPCTHVHHLIEMTMRAPAKSAGALPAPDAEPAKFAVELIAPASGEVLESRPAHEGTVDLAAMFPRLWTTESPQVLYAQAVVGKERIGAPVVLVPMITPPYAPRVERDGTPRLNPPSAPGKTSVLAGYWTYTEQRVEIDTNKGRLVFALHPEGAPKSVENFRDLVAKGFYDGVLVHRVASLSGRTLPDIIQFGDPTGTGLGGPGYFIDYEPSPLKHGFGTLSYARTSDPNSAASQVFICLGRESGGRAQLDGKYTVFGQLITGAETLVAISKTPVDADGKPKLPVVIESAKLVDAPPFGTGPKPEMDPFEKPSGR